MSDNEDVLVKLADLHVQATNERSHYYTGSVIREAILEITALRGKLAEIEIANERNESP